jgi:microtubule-associated protein-like 1/2
MKYSPNGNFLAIGTHHQRIFIFSVKGKYKAVKALDGKKLAMDSAINGLDWSITSSMIRTSSLSHDIMVWDVDNKGHRNYNTHGSSVMPKEEWVNHTIKRGWLIEGIYPKGEDGTHINDICISNTNDKGPLVFTADDWGLLNVYNNPVRHSEGTGKMYRAHSEHVMRIALEGEDADRVYTVGG